MSAGASRKFHTGISSTVAKIRSCFWVINLRKSVKSIRHKCIRCKIDNKKSWNAKHGEVSSRAIETKCSLEQHITGFFQTINSKGWSEQKGRGKDRILFTCFACGAVHLELAPNYSSEGFLLALWWFVSLCGYPSKLYSDPGTQLTAADKELRSLLEDLDWETLKIFGVEKGMEWNFTPADAPW